MMLLSIWTVNVDWRLVFVLPGSNVGALIIPRSSWIRLDIVGTLQATTGATLITVRILLTA